MIQFETPYLVVAEKIAKAPTKYHAPEAEEEFLGKPAICRVNVEVGFDAWRETNPPIIDGAFRFPTGAIGSDLSILLEQNGKPIGPQQVSHWGLLSGDEGPVTGISVQLDYDAEKIDPASPVKVKVFTPDGQEVDAEFDLTNLR